MKPIHYNAWNKLKQNTKAEQRLQGQATLLLSLFFIAFIIARVLTYYH